MGNEIGSKPAGQISPAGLQAKDFVAGIESDLYQHFTLCDIKENVIKARITGYSLNLLDLSER